ncbi:hypothetical protein [Campylobacter jejuni]|uniref:hypothetical protein n=1 Tax=Campylobacter jejuni TaxID=197 RepID=UPI003BA83920
MLILETPAFMRGEYVIRESTGDAILMQARIKAVRDIIQSKYTKLRERIRNSFKKTIKKAKQIKRDFGISR